jgi:hypothetical protein
MSIIRDVISCSMVVLGGHQALPGRYIKYSSRIGCTALLGKRQQLVAATVA